MQNPLNHFDNQGHAVMVDVSAKQATHRIAAAEGRIRMNKRAFDAVCQGSVAKGDVLGVARVAGILGLKRTSELIPLCHPLMTEKASIEFTLEPTSCSIHAVCIVQVSGKTGVEMEALTGVNIALLTIYDMCKAADRGIEIYDIRLLHKQGGKSGVYHRLQEDPKDD